MDTPLRVLIIEDSERDVALEVRALKAAGYQVTHAVAETAAEMEACLLKQTFDIVIADNDMPQFDAQGALAVLKESGLDIPFIIVSGSIGQEIGVALMKAGAHDFVMKDSPARLLPAVQRELKEAESRRERKRAEEALANERIMLARTEGIAHIGSWEWDIATDRVIWSDELFRIFQRDPREGAPSFAEHPAFYHPDDMARLRLAVEAVVADGTPYELELRAIRKDRETRMCVARGVVELGPDGRPVRLFGSLQDITERLKAKEALRDSETRFREMFDDAPIGYHELDSEGRVNRVNRTELAILGYSAEEMLGRHVWEFVDEKDIARKAVLDKLSGILPSGENLERYYRKKDGTRIPVLIQDLIIRGKDGKINGIRTTLQDITYRKLADKQLQDTVESLRKAFNGTIQVIASAVESRDPYTSGHQIRSANLARAIATELGLPPEKIESTWMAGSIHDVGKLSIPAELLSKPTKLTPIELLLIKEHANRGYEILKDVESPWPLAEIVYQHHERMDGSGYPRNLKSGEILIEARILSVADVVEAMASHRPYRPGLGIDAALNEIEKNRGIFYDEAVVDVCLRLFREKGFKLEGDL